MLAAEVLANVRTAKSTNICRRTRRLRLASSSAVIAICSCWMALGTAASEAVTTAAATADDAEANVARNEFLQSLFAELSKSPGTNYDAFRIVWRREHQPRQPCPTAGSVHCFDRPPARLPSEGQLHERSYRAVLVVAAVQQQTESKAPCGNRTWMAQACVGTRCFNQTLPSFYICEGGGNTALIDATELLASNAASTAEHHRQQGEDGLCVSLMWESNIHARAINAIQEARMEATLLVYNADEQVKGLQPMLSATQAAILGVAASCGQRMPTASDAPLSQSPTARHHRRRHVRRTPYTGPLGACSLRPWTISYDDVPNDLFEKPYFPRVQNVNYCVGSCQSLTPHASLNFTRHAFMRTRQFGDDVTGILVPKPCCVPVAFWPTTMAYIERNGMMRIEQREDLSVRACGCR